MITENIAKDYYVALEHDNKTIEHIGAVYELCQEFILCGMVLDYEILTDAVWLHDIAKVINDEEHHKPKHLKSALDKLNKSKESEISISRQDEIFEIIKAHKKKFKPQKFHVEAAILRICDKLDKFRMAANKENKNKAYKKAIKKCGDSMKEISKWLIKQNLHADYENFKKIYDGIYDKKIKFYIKNE